MKMRSPDHSLVHTKLLWILLAVSAVVRILFFMQAKNLDVFSVPILDCRVYQEWAERLVAGNWDWGETYWMGPLYPHLLALGFKLFGTGHEIVMACQLTLSLLNIWLVYLVGQGLLTPDQETGESVSRSNTIALVAALLYAFYGAPVFYAGLQLMAVLTITILLLITFQATRVVRHHTLRNWFLLGLLIGLGGLARGNFLILLAGFPGLLWQRNSTLVTKKHLQLVLALWLGGAVMIVPATLRNVIVGGDWVMLTSNGGLNLLVGQQAAYKGTFAPVGNDLKTENDKNMALELESEAGHELKDSELSRILALRAWEMFHSDIKTMPLHYARKAFRFWNGYELPQIASYDYWRHEIPALKPLAFPFMVFSALGLLGLVYMPSLGHERGLRILLIILVGYFLSLMPFFPTARYRQPLVPLLAITTAVYLFRLVQWSRQSDLAENRANVLAKIGIACLMVLVMHPIWTAIDPALVRWQVAMNGALRASRKGDLNLVLAKGKQAEEFRPGLAWTPFSLAGNLDEMEALDEAYTFYVKAARIQPNHRIIPYRMGRNRERAEDFVPALKALGMAATIDPNWASPYLRTSLILRKLGKKEQALAAIKKAVALSPGNVRIRVNYGSLLAENGHLTAAEIVFKRLTVDFPNNVHGWFNLALLEAQLGHKVTALQALEKAESIVGLDAKENEQILKLRLVLQQ